jgi:SAM-dependent methyltransferase
MPATSTTPTTTDFETIKTRQQATWSSGDYAVIGTTLQIVGESLCEAVDIAAGEQVLDVAAGNGNATLAAARRGGVVTASDYVSTLLDGTRARAAAEGLTIDVREADAEALPFADASFDVVLSTFGVMFTPNQERSAAELARVCRPGGRIGLANWTPEGFVGQMFKIVGKYAPPPAGVRSPLQWGTDERLAELFGSDVRTLDVPRRNFVFRFRSAQEWLDTFRDYYGPTHKAFASLDGAGQEAFAQELIALANAHNTSTTTLRIPSEYVEVVAVKAG